MPYVILVFIFQILCAVHCARRCRNRSWLFLILLFPFVGSLIYLIVEIIPEWERSPQARRLAQDMSRKLNPTQEIERLQGLLELSDTVKNRENLADEYMRSERYAEALEHYRHCLSGLYENDPALLFKYAEACFAQKDYAPAVVALQRICQHSDYRRQAVRLQLALGHEALDQPAEAEAIYQEMLKGHADMESKCRYGLFLHTQNRQAEANALFAEILRSARHQPKAAQQLNQKWIALARQYTQPPEALNSSALESV